MAATTNLFIDQGSDFTADIDLVQDTGTALDLYGANVFSQMRRSYYSATSFSFDTSIVDEANGIIRIAMDGTTSGNIKAGRYVYDVLIEQSGTKTRVLEGIVTLYPEVTRT